MNIIVVIVIVNYKQRKHFSAQASLYIHSLGILFSHREDVTLIEGEMPVLPISSPKVISLEG